MRFCGYYTLPLLVLIFATLNAHAATNEEVVVEQPPTAPDLVYPVTSFTNTEGVVVHQFSMKPAVTNLVAATNDLARLKAELQTIEMEMKKASEEAGTIRTTMRNNYREIVGVMTNFTARNPEGKKLQDRITVLETELKTLKQELQAKMDGDEAFEQAKTKIDSGRDAYKKAEESLAKLGKKRVEVSARVWQLQTVVDQTRKAKESELKASDNNASKTSP